MNLLRREQPHRVRLNGFLRGHESARTKVPVTCTLHANSTGGGVACTVEYLEPGTWTSWWRTHCEVTTLAEIYLDVFIMSV